MKYKRLKIVLLILLVVGLSFILLKDYEHSHQGHHHSSEEANDEHSESHQDHEEHNDHEEQGEEKASGGVGPGKAVTEADPDQGLKLSEKTIQLFEVATKPLGAFPFSVPISSLVYYQEEIGVYRLRDGWFKLIEVKLLSKSGKQAMLESSDLMSADQIVIQGAALLRVAELDAFNGGEEGHGH